MEVATLTGLTRTATAPSNIATQRLQSSSGPHPLIQNPSYSASQYSISTLHPSQRAAPSTHSTAPSAVFPAAATAAPTPVNGGPIEATNNVMNKVADKEASLFQICLSLRQRLRGVDGFEEQLKEIERDADDDTDPVTLLWRTFRKGHPLMTIYNAMDPPVRLQIDPSKVREANRAKAATFKFLQACVSVLKFPQEECFIITDLYGDDTSGFVKVAKVVNRVLDILVKEGFLSSAVNGDNLTSELNTAAQRTQRQHIIDELVRTERTYVQHLELLQSFKLHVEGKGIVTGDAVHDIFLNLNALLDFQRRFLIRVEQTNAQPEEEQNWGKLFVLYREAFKVYEPFIANQKRCEETALKEFERLKETGGPEDLRQMVESSTHFSSFLLKPFQRLTKYPLLLKDLRDKGNLDDDRKADISLGMEAASSVLQRTNAAIDREERIEAVQELKERVEDWKGHRIEGFGDLLLHGTYTVLKGESSAKDAEREYKIFLFEAILLCCKEVNPNKQKNKLIGKPSQDKTSKAKLQLKGRIFMQNVTETISIGKPGSYTCQIFWKGDPGIENFVIRFPSEDAMKKWAAQVDAQRRLNKEVTSTSSGSKSSGTSETEFTYFRGVQMENPYRTEDYDDDYDSASTGYHQGMPRIGSTTSLRSRSTTGDSALSMSNAPRTRPPRFPMLPGNAQPLSLRTQQSPGPTDGLGDSYFSPTTETPGSTRVSTSSGIFPFPKQVQASGWQASEEYSNSRYTAPAMGRITSRENQLGNGSVGSVGRTMGRAPAAMSGANAQMNSSQSRLRSASSPDISNAIPPNRRAMSTQPPMPSVPVPPFPAHIQYGPAAIANRSQSSSPSHASTGRSNIRAQSPSMQRERSQKATYEQGSYGQVGVQHNYGQGYAASYGHGLDGTSHQSPAGMPQAHTFSHPPSYAQPLPPSLSLSQTHSQSQLQFQMPSQPRQSQHSRTPTAGSIDSRDMPALSPHSLPTSAPRGLDATLSQHQEVEEIVTPSQIKVKVHCPSAGSTMTLVVSTTISYQLLKDRIDAKLQRSTSLSLSSGNVKLKYLDENDYVSIQSDEDVQTAIETWKEQQRDRFLAAGQMGEIELFCQR